MSRGESRGRDRVAAAWVWAGTVLGGGVVAVHPVLPRPDQGLEALAHVRAEPASWVASHAVLAAGLFLWVGGLERLLAGGPALKGDAREGARLSARLWLLAGFALWLSILVIEGAVLPALAGTSGPAGGDSRAVSSVGRAAWAFGILLGDGATALMAYALTRAGAALSAEGDNVFGTWGRIAGWLGFACLSLAAVVPRVALAAVIAGVLPGVAWALAMAWRAWTGPSSPGEPETTAPQRGGMLS